MMSRLESQEKKRTLSAAVVAGEESRRPGASLTPSRINAPSDDLRNHRFDAAYDAVSSVDGSASAVSTPTERSERDVVYEQRCRGLTIDDRFVCIKEPSSTGKKEDDSGKGNMKGAAAQERDLHVDPKIEVGSDDNSSKSRSSSRSRRSSGESDEYSLESLNKTCRDVLDRSNETTTPVKAAIASLLSDFPISSVCAVTAGDVIRKGNERMQAPALFPFVPDFFPACGTEDDVPPNLCPPRPDGRHPAQPLADREAPFKPPPFFVVPVDTAGGESPEAKRSALENDLFPTSTETDLFDPRTCPELSVDLSEKRDAPLTDLSIFDTVLSSTDFQRALVPSWSSVGRDPTQLPRDVLALFDEFASSVAVSPAGALAGSKGVTFKPERSLQLRKWLVHPRLVPFSQQLEGVPAAVVEDQDLPLGIRPLRPDGREDFIETKYFQADTPAITDVFLSQRIEDWRKQYSNSEAVPRSPKAEDAEDEEEEETESGEESEEEVEEESDDAKV